MEQGRSNSKAHGFCSMPPQGLEQDLNERKREEKKKKQLKLKQEVENT